jgi:hypothetical protein
MGQHHLPHQKRATITKSREPTKAPPVVGLAIVRSEGPVPPPNALKSDLPVSSVTQRDWLLIYAARASRPSVGRAR